MRSRSDEWVTDIGPAGLLFQEHGKKGKTWASGLLCPGPEPGSGKVRLPLCDVHLDPVFELRGLLPMQAGLAGWRARRLASGMLSGVLLTT